MRRPKGWQASPSLHNPSDEWVLIVQHVLSFWDMSFAFVQTELHANYFSKNVRVFKAVNVFFSIGGEYFLGEPVRYESFNMTLEASSQFAVRNRILSLTAKYFMNQMRFMNHFAVLTVC